MSERLPRPDGGRISDAVPLEDELLRVPRGTQLVRVHPLAGAHPSTWDGLRRFGPTSARFDHQTRPRRIHPTRGIAYVTSGAEAFVAALAEWFQDGSGGVLPFDLGRGRPAVTLFETAEDLVLLDLDSGWVTRAGGNQAIRSGPRGVARDWSRAVHRHHGEVQGLAYGSSVRGPGRCMALYERARGAFPSEPVATRTLDDPVMRMAITKAALDLGTFVL